VQHQLGVGEEVVRTPAQVDAVAPRSRDGMTVQSRVPRPFDDPHAVDAVAEDVSQGGADVVRHAVGRARHAASLGGHP
jgi:hypothetical protein